MDKDKERKQMEGLHEIFTFYAKQHMMAGKMPTFDQIEHSNQIIKLGDFMKFCKDFDFKVSKHKCTEVFKKTAINSIEMRFEQFQRSLGKLFNEMAKEESKALAKRLKEVKRLYFNRKAFIKNSSDDGPNEEGEGESNAISDEELKERLNKDKEVIALRAERDRIVA